MRLRWKQFERRLQARVRRYDARRHMRFWQRVDHFLNASPVVPLWLGRALASLMFAGTVLVNASSVLAHPDLTMAGLGLWALAVTVSRAWLVWNTSQIDPEYRALWMLPVTTNRIFHYLLRRLARGSLWLFAEFLLVYGILAAGSQQSALWWGGTVVCAASQAAFSTVLTVVLVALKIKTDWIWMPLLLLAAVLPNFSRPQTELSFAKAFYLCNPFGWLNATYLKGWVRGDAQAWWCFVPVIAVSASLPLALRSIRRLHHQGIFRTVPARRKGLFVIAVDGAPHEAEDLTGQGRRILSEESLKPLDWNRFGLVERLIARVLSSREKIVAEMLLLAEPRWSRSFLGFLVYLFLYLAANTAIHFESLDDLVMALLRPERDGVAGLVGFIASLVLFAMMLAKSIPLFFGLGWPEPTPTSRPSGLRPYRTFRLFPVNYWDATRTIAKINTVIFILLLPLAVLFSLTPAYELFFRRAPHGSAIMPKCLTLLWGCTLLISSMKLTPSIQEGLVYWKSSLRKLLVLVSSYFVGMGLLLSPTVTLDILLGGFFILGLPVWLTYCGALYRKNVR